MQSLRTVARISTGRKVFETIGNGYCCLHGREIKKIAWAGGRNILSVKHNRNLSSDSTVDIKPSQVREKDYGGDRNTKKRRLSQPKVCLFVIRKKAWSNLCCNNPPPLTDNSCKYLHPLGLDYHNIPSPSPRLQ